MVVSLPCPVVSFLCPTLREPGQDKPIRPGERAKRKADTLKNSWFPGRDRENVRGSSTRIAAEAVSQPGLYFGRAALIHPRAKGTATAKIFLFIVVLSRRAEETGAREDCHQRGTVGGH